MNDEAITLATQNTQSLGQDFIERCKKKEIKSLFTQTTPTTDVLLMQETKIPEASCLKQARFIEFKGGSSLWNEGSFSTHSRRFKGGTSIVLLGCMASNVAHHGILYPRRAQQVVVKINPCLQLGIMNVYGFSHTGPRAMMWNHMAHVTLPQTPMSLLKISRTLRTPLTNKAGHPRRTLVVGN